MWDEDICEAKDPELSAAKEELSAAKERLQSMENSLAELRLSVKASKAWQREHDETTENL